MVYKIKRYHYQGRGGARMVNGVVCKTTIREFDSHPPLKQRTDMKIRDLVKRLEDIETSLDKKEDKENSNAVGELIEDIIEFDIKAEREIRREIKKFIDKEIEHRVVEEAIHSGSIAQA